MSQSAEVVTIRRRSTVPYEEFHNLLQQAIKATNSNQSQIMRAAGYSDSVIAAWAKTGHAPLCAKYTLMGLLAELNVTISIPTKKQFSYSDLLTILTALARDPAEPRHLISIVAKQIAEYD